MRRCVSSRIVPRTTLDLDPAVLDELRRRGERDRKSMGQVASELLAPALAQEVSPTTLRPLRWVHDDLGTPNVPLEDKEALRAALEA